MSQVHYDVTFTESRNRVTTGFRLILGIPHLILANSWSNAASGTTSIFQWFSILFTGKRRRDLYDFQRQWMGYSSRTWSYQLLLFDEYPRFANDASGVPTAFVHEYEEEPPNRVSSALRLIWAIPALLVSIALAVAVVFVCIIHWFAILFTGKANRGMWNFTRRVLNYGLQTEAYVMLMTDTYPKY